MRNFIARLLAGCMVVAPISGLAQEAVPIGQGEVVEHYEAAAQISGSSIMGLSLAGALDPSRNLISALVPGAWQGKTFCVRIVSSDGRYLAQRSYLVPGKWHSQMVALDFPTRRSRELPEVSSQDIGLTLWEGDCASIPVAMRIAPAIWNGDLETVPDAELLVNSFRATETYLMVDTRRFNCTALSHERRTAFDTVCTLPAEMLTGESLTVDVNRIRRGNLLLGETFVIVLE